MLQAGVLPIKTVEEWWMIHLQIGCKCNQQLDSLFATNPDDHIKAQEAFLIDRVSMNIPELEGDLSSLLRAIQCVQRTVQVATIELEKRFTRKQTPTEENVGQLYSVSSDTRVEISFAGGSLDMNPGMSLLLPSVRVESTQTADSKRIVGTALDLTWKLSVTKLYCKLPNSVGYLPSWIDVLQLGGIEASSSYSDETKSIDGKESSRKLVAVVRIGKVDLKLSRYNVSHNSPSESR